MTATVTHAPGTAVDFATPLPGLSPYTRFTLDPLEGAEGLFALRAVDADVRLFLLDPGATESGYEPTIPAAIRELIGADADATLRLLVVANPADDGVYLNLRAPIVIHPETGRAVQAILEDQAYPIRARLGGD